MLSDRDQSEQRTSPASILPVHACLYHQHLCLLRHLLLHELELRHQYLKPSLVFAEPLIDGLSRVWHVFLACLQIEALIDLGFFLRLDVLMPEKEVDEHAEPGTRSW